LINKKIIQQIDFIMKDSKNLKTVFILITLFFATQLLMASNTLLPNVNIASIGVSKKIKVTIGELKQMAQVTIADEYGSILISEQTDNPTFARLYNLELLPEGQYKVNVNTGQKEVEQILFIERAKITVDPKLRREYLLPLVQIEQKMVNVMMLNTRITDVTVKIKNDRGDIIFTDKLGSVVKVEKRYDVAALQRGKYQVVIQTPDKTFYRDIYNN
jgi:hypothetical protein